ncbi:hypothetical protein PILCRDRAFT_76604 [Piloderma croceum F 1598]|uniref:SWIM-type domain-containing protein n=1 Tax=Piloderma croceum (strain F 1598) TaxID=765440 RepID=A0A0C3FCI1_PILCF|nr:hypothetical protein PILCRDRAFT_76604 [Piloderma croceum F 1598]
MPKRILHDDDEVEIVSTSFDIPRTGTAIAGSSSNPYAKPKPTARKPRVKKEKPAAVSTGPSISACDPHPFSYPAKLAPPVLQNPATNSAAQPPAKKQRKKKVDPDAPVPEKRGAMFKKACPKNILDRVDRVMSQRFFMIDRTRIGEELREEFKVLGSTGNVYTVTIDRTPTCNCPDATKGNHCKHILFIFLKGALLLTIYIPNILIPLAVLQVSQQSGLWYQKALLTPELETIFAQAPLAPNSIAHPRIRDAYARATGKATSVASSSKSQPENEKRRIPGPDDDCPICYESMHGADKNKLTWCDECGNALHQECFDQWARTSGNNLTCVWCRAKWILPASGNGAASGSMISEGYVNLGSVAGVNTVRDTSSCMNYALAFCSMLMIGLRRLPWTGERPTILWLSGVLVISGMRKASNERFVLCLRNYHP